MSKNKQQKANGFTLAEVLVYCAVFSLATVMIAQLMLDLARDQRRFNAERSLRRHGQFLLDRVAYSARNAKAMEIVSPSEIRLTSRDYEAGVDYYTFYRIINGRWEAAQGYLPAPHAGDWQALNSPRIMVDQAVFRRTGTALSADFTLKNDKQEINFQSIDVLRQPDN